MGIPARAGAQARHGREPSIVPRTSWLLSDAQASVEPHARPAAARPPPACEATVVCDESGEKSRASVPPRKWNLTPRFEFRPARKDGRPRPSAAQGRGWQKQALIRILSCSELATLIPKPASCNLDSHRGRLLFDLINLVHLPAQPAVELLVGHR